MANKIGNAVKKARTEAGLTQEQLAKKVKGCTASDISKLERGEKELTRDQLKQIAGATGVTQKSLLEAAAGSRYSDSSKKETSSGKTTSSGKSTSAKSSSKSSDDGIKLTAAEKEIIELYRKADSDTKKKVRSILKDEDSGASELLQNILGSAMKDLLKK